MYSRLLLNVCERYLYKVSNSVRLQIKRLRHATNKDEKTRLVETVSTKFPDYKVIYFFPYIKHANGINTIKYQCTILAGMAVPVIFGFQLSNIISFDTSISLIASEVILMIWLHTFGILCNNLVGYIYLKLDEQKVVLSYVDYWGKRIDFKTTFDEIIPISDSSISITDPLYRKIIFSSQKRKLKINMKLGQIIDMEHFRCILGMV